MSLLRSGLLLFVSVTGLATLFVAIWSFTGSGSYGQPWLTGGLLLVPLGFSAVTFPATAILTFAAWLGRRRPVLDGLLLLPGIGLVACYCLYLGLQHSGDPRIAFWAILVAPMYYLAGLVCAVPAYLIACEETA